MRKVARIESQCCRIGNTGTVPQSSTVPTGLCLAVPYYCNYSRAADVRAETAWQAGNGKYPGQKCVHDLPRDELCISSLVLAFAPLSWLDVCLEQLPKRVTLVASSQ